MRSLAKLYVGAVSELSRSRNFPLLAGADLLKGWNTHFYLDAKLIGLKDVGLAVQ